MDIIAVILSRTLNDAMEMHLRSILPDMKYTSFAHAEAAAEYIGRNACDLIIIENDPVNSESMELAHIVHEAHPKAEILFLTGESQDKLTEAGVQQERCVTPFFGEAILRHKLSELPTLPPFDDRLERKCSKGIIARLRSRLFSHVAKDSATSFSR